MDIFAKVLQGPYAYLLILQVLIVSGLCLTLIYLILLRLREVPAMQAAMSAPPLDVPPVVADGTLSIVTQAAAETPVVEAPPMPLEIPTAMAPVAGAPSAPAPAPTPTPDPLPMNMPPIAIPDPSTSAAALFDPQALTAEKERTAALEQEAAMSKDKVRYLESKLLEYEILQEEIGTLSTLKLENEKLRQELMSLKTAPAPAAPAVVPPPSTPSANEPDTVSPEDVIASNPLAKQAAESASELLAKVELPTPKLDSVEPVDVQPNPVAESQLDSLMGQIESLTRK